MTWFMMQLLLDVLIHLNQVEHVQFHQMPFLVEARPFKMIFHLTDHFLMVEALQVLQQVLYLCQYFGDFLEKLYSLYPEFILEVVFENLRLPPMLV